MVSLENTRNLKGGFSFDNISNVNEDQIEAISNGVGNQIDTLPLTSEIEPNFKKISTTFAIFLQILLTMGLMVSVFLIPYLCGENDLNCGTIGTFDLVVYIHGTFWLIKFLFDRFYHFHHMKSRRNGYLTFYRVTRLVRSLPLLIISAGNSILVVLVRVITRFCPVKCTSENLTPINFLQIFVGLETLLLMPILIYYFYQTIIFNKSKKSPDINKEIDRPIFVTSQLKNIGYKDSSYLSNVLENQADMLRYLQERNENLTKKLYQVNNKTTNPANIN